MIEYLLIAVEMFYACMRAFRACVRVTERETIRAVPLIGAVQLSLYFIRRAVR